MPRVVLHVLMLSLGVVHVVFGIRKRQGVTVFAGAVMAIDGIMAIASWKW